jgi:hypothetical protein
MCDSRNASEHRDSSGRAITAEFDSEELTDGNADRRARARRSPRVRA